MLSAVNSCLSGPELRASWKPFGNAVLKDKNRECTSFGDEVAMELNPMLFIGNKGEKVLDTYLESAIRNLAKDPPVPVPLIHLKDEFYVRQQVMETYEGDIPDWWNDENILTQELPKSERRNIYKVPEFVYEKVTVINNLIRSFPIKREALGPVQFRELPAGRDGGAPSYFVIPVRRQAAAGQQQQPQRGVFLGEYSIRVNNVSDPDGLNMNEFRDFLCENGLPECFNYKITHPKDKETGDHRDFLFLNFNDEKDMKEAFDLLIEKRVRYVYGILAFELSTR
jgi:hypothetical protein